MLNAIVERYGHSLKKWFEIGMAVERMKESTTDIGELVDTCHITTEVVSRLVDVSSVSPEVTEDKEREDQVIEEQTLLDTNSTLFDDAVKPFTRVIETSINDIDDVLSQSYSDKMAIAGKTLFLHDLIRALFQVC